MQTIVENLTRRAYRKTRSIIRSLRKTRIRSHLLGKGIKVAFIHYANRGASSGGKNGAFYINRLIAKSLSKSGAKVGNFYPRQLLQDTPAHMREFANILFFHSLLERKDDILKYNIIHGNTYYPLPFLSFKIPIVSHFGSTNFGCLKNTPKTVDLEPKEKAVLRELYDTGIIPAVDTATLRPHRDIADVEKLVATRVAKCIATSLYVKKELIEMGVMPDRIELVHNAIEDYWFEKCGQPVITAPHIVFLGRLGDDVYWLKLKGLDRLVDLYRAFPQVPKTTICISPNKKLIEWLRTAFPLHYLHVNLSRESVPDTLERRFGSILFITSRYEGFSLSLIEGMSQGLVPITYSVGVAPEIIKNGENGYIVYSNEEAKARVGELLTNNEKRLAMAEAARKTTAQFRSNIIAGKLLNIYKKLKERPHTLEVMKEQKRQSAIKPFAAVPS